MKYRSSITVTCDGIEQAERVLADRLDCEDDLGFDYAIERGPVFVIGDPPLPLPGDRVHDRLVIASQYWGDDMARLILLNPDAPFYSFVTVALEPGLPILDAATHRNIHDGCDEESWNT